MTATILQFRRPHHNNKARAMTLYWKADKLDTDPATIPEAVAMYEQALELDPSLGIAWTNLGNARYRQGDEVGALKAYEQALRVNPEQPEALYNIGYLALEDGALGKAEAFLCSAVESDPTFADAHYNYAVCLTQAGAPNLAQPHWREFLRLEPDSEWSDNARENLTIKVVR